MAGKVNGWAGRVLAGIVVLVAAGVSGAALSNTSRLGAIEANRFTADDGLAVWQAIANIQAEIASHPTEVPPAWFVARVDRIDRKLDEIERRLDGIE
jgi:hypothetical protein